MGIANLIVGLFMIGIGFLVKSAPDLIAGYNSMPKDKKENIDIEGLSTFVRNGSIIIGLSIIIGYYSFKWIGFTKIANSISPVVSLVGVSILALGAQRFDHNKNKNTKLTYLIIGVMFIFVIGVMAFIKNYANIK